MSKFLPVNDDDDDDKNDDDADADDGRAITISRFFSSVTLNEQ